METTRRTKTRITVDLLEYLTENPAAQDTLEGIVEWWLLDRRVERETEVVRQVLAELTAQGLLVMRTGPNSRAHYRVNPERYDEIQNRLIAARTASGASDDEEP